MSAPAALAVSKISYPETEESPTATGKKGAYDIPPSDDVNVFHAACNGAVIGTMLVLNIAGNLIAFLAIIEMLDQLIIYLGARVDIVVSFNILCELFFYPIAWLMGVDPADCRAIAGVIGYKIFANEFVAYEILAFQIRDSISDRSFYIASYALAGFSNFSSIGIQLGGLTPLAPEQGPKLAKLVLSAMIAGNTACFMTACIAGIFYVSPDTAE
jgi:nucleoside permease NupC